MKVSCICITFQRPPTYTYLLEEAIQSFLQQNWNDKELIIINDCPEQKLVFEHPEVKIINLPLRCRTYGEKMAMGVALAQGDYLAPWDDDDISLPMRLTIAMDTLRALGSQYYKAHGQWLLNKHGLSNMESFVGHNSSVFSRKAYAKVGGYPIMSSGADLEIDRAFRLNEPPATNELDRTRWQYIYRWGISDIHMSSLHDKDNVEKGWDHIGKKVAEPGEFKLEPKWLYNYSNLTAQAARSGLAVYPTPDLVFWGD